MNGRKLRYLGFALLALSGFAAPGAAFAQGAPSDTSAVQASDDAFPPPRTISQEARISGQVLKYDVTVEAIPTHGAGDKVTGHVVTMSYIVPSKTPRPVAFVFNGGPGAASGFLNIGALGPKRVQFGAQGNSPSDSLIPEDNPNTWLEFTDLVFIDPIGTGFSRSELGPEETATTFYGINQDASYLARVVYDWLKAHGRMSSDKYLVGESYGGFRVPRIAAELQVWNGVGPKGLMLISPYLDGRLLSPGGGEKAAVSPMAAMVRLPSMAAANFSANGTPLSPEIMTEVEDYARGQFPADWLKGWSDPDALARLQDRLIEYTGLSEEAVERVGGRIDQSYFLRERFKSDALMASRYDINVTIPDPDPWSAYNVPMDAVASTFTMVGGAMTDLITNTLGWKADGKYWVYNPTVGRDWYNQGVDPESVSALRGAMSLDPKMNVVIAHGYADLSCPYFASTLIIDQMPPGLTKDRLDFKIYDGGHMFYSRPGSGASFREDVRAIFEQ